MKKLLTAAAVVTALYAFPASALDSTGCGLGSMAFKGAKGMAPQVLAVTTNGFFGTQTFGITSGTSGCDSRGTVSGGTGRMFAFLEKNFEQFAADASRGHGETIDTIAGIMGVSSEEVGSVAKQNFAVLFDATDASALTVSMKMSALLNS